MKIKMLIRALIICLIHGILASQSTSTTTITRVDNIAMDRSFIRSLRANPPAVLVLFDTKDKEWEQDFERIRREDPFAILNLNFIRLAIDQGTGEELREREGWLKQKPHWAIYSKGRLVADGAILPTSAQLADACADAGIISWVETYRRFLREHPNHEEARGVMLQEMVATAAIRTRNALQVPEFRKTGRFVSTEIGGINMSDAQDTGEPSAEQLESLPELTPDADERIWKDYCVELQRYLEGVLWQSEGNNAPSSRPIITAWAKFSPITKAAYSKAAITVEAALARQPSSITLWGLWVTLQKTGVGKSMKELLSELQPSPNVAPDDWPPTSIRTPYLKSCRETGDWRTIQELVEPIWDRLSNINQALQSAKVENTANLIGDINLFERTFWVSSGEAYIESLLRQQRLADAEQMMRTWEAGRGWPGAFVSAAAIADRLGYTSAAKAWKEMGRQK